MPAVPQELPALVLNQTNPKAALLVVDLAPQSQATCVKDKEIFGDILNNKDENILRIRFINIGGLPVNQHRLKDDLLRQGITSLQIDVCGLAETNTDWRLMKEDERLYSRTHGWWESIHLSFNHNSHSLPIEKCQMGWSHSHH
jgi:hypothetical protein